MTYTKEQLREIQLKELELLKYFDALCQKHHLKYVLFYGTLLGAVRHQGFIPWDDDIDVCMPREDYNKLIEIAKSELDKNHTLQYSGEGTEYFCSYAKLRDENTTYLETLIKDVDMSHGLFIDIFPVDNIPDSKILRKIHCYRTYFLVSLRMARVKSLCTASPSWKVRAVKRCLHMLSMLIPKKALEKHINRVASKYNSKQTKQCTVAVVNSISESYNIFLRKEYFTDTIPMRFEDALFPVPKDYDEALIRCYGNYMELPPEDKRVANHNTQVIDVNNSYLKYKKQKI